MTTKCYPHSPITSILDERRLTDKSIHIEPVSVNQFPLLSPSKFGLVSFFLSLEFFYFGWRNKMGLLHFALLYAGASSADIGTYEPPDFDEYRSFGDVLQSPHMANSIFQHLHASNSSFRHPNASHEATNNKTHLELGLFSRFSIIATHRHRPLVNAIFTTPSSGKVQDLL